MTLAWVCSAVLAGPLSGADLDRRSADLPEMAVEAGGRFGRASSLQFTPDGKFVAVAGDDKTLRLFPVGPTGFGKDKSKIEILRWPGWREQRGTIETVAMTADGSTFLVGGFGMRTSTAALLKRSDDPQRGNFLGLTWPGGGGTYGKVVASAFLPDQRRTVFGTADGSIWLWDAGEQKPRDADGRLWATPTLLGKHEANRRDGAVPAINPSTLLLPRGDDRIVSIAESGEALEITVAAKPVARSFFQLNDGLRLPTRLTRTVAAANGTLASATRSRLVLVYSSDGKNLRTLTLGEDEYARSVALSPDGKQLAVAVAKALPKPTDGARFYLEADDRAVVYDLSADGKDFPVLHEFKQRGSADALAFHPTEDKLAVATGSDGELLLYQLGTPKAPPSTQRGHGRDLWSVALSKNGKTLGVRSLKQPEWTNPNQRGTGSWATFQLDTLNRPKPGVEHDWLVPLESADGWTVAPDAESRFVWYAVNGTRRLKLDLGYAANPSPSCFTFLPALAGKPTRLLVGHYYGATLFELSENSVRRAARYTGHGGAVHSLCASADQTWFVSSGADQTVAAWSLNDFAHHPLLGADFAFRNGQAVVTKVAVGSPAWEAGLSVEEIITTLHYDGDVVYDRAGGKPVGEEAAFRKALKDAVAGRELLLTTGTKQTRLTTLPRRPLWKWFPSFDADERLVDWVVWMWNSSYYFTRTANGDAQAGWVVNPPEIDGRPEFHPLVRFRNQFERFDLLNQLVNTRDLEAVLKLARDDNPLPERFGRTEPALVRLEKKTSAIRDGKLELLAFLEQAGRNPDFQAKVLELWLNDHRYHTWSLDAKPAESLKLSLTIPEAAFRVGENRLTLVSINALGGRAEARTVVAGPSIPLVTPKTLGVSVGIQDYQDHRKNPGGARSFGDLNYAADDAKALAAHFKLVEKAERDPFALRLNRSATRNQIVEALAGLRETVKPDDHVVIFFAGHGDFVPAGTVKDVRAGRGFFYYCCPDYSRNQPAATAVSAEQLFELLAGVNCRKTVLLDACHAGEATNENAIRRFIPAGFGPCVIAACDQSEQSYEHPELGHGVFTWCVLDALDKRRGFGDADRNRDGSLDVDELFNFVARKVPSKLKQLKLTQEQNPISFPADLPELTFSR